MVLLSETEYTVESAIRTAAAAFEDHGLYFGHGTDTAVDEASWLILSGMGKSPLIAPDYAQKLTALEQESCNQLCQRRITERVPTAYITGEAWFAGHRFLADERAVVPRSPLAEFITEGFFGIFDGCEAPRILDLCTGGG